MYVRVSLLCVHVSVHLVRPLLVNASVIASCGPQGANY